MVKMHMLKIQILLKFKEMFEETEEKSLKRAPPEDFVNKMTDEALNESNVSNESNVPRF